MSSISFAPIAIPDAGGIYVITGQTQELPAGAKLILKTQYPLANGDSGEIGIGSATVEPDGTFAIRDLVIFENTFITASYTDPKTKTTIEAQAPFSFDGLRHESVYSPVDGSFLYQATLDQGGSTTIDVAGSGESVQSFFFDTIHNGGQADNVFVFAPNHGLDIVDGFRSSGSGHDTLSFQLQDFDGSIAAVLQNAHNAKGGVVILDPATGDTVKLPGIGKGQLVHNTADIAFHL